MQHNALCIHTQTVCAWPVLWVQTVVCAVCRNVTQQTSNVTQLTCLVTANNWRREVIEKLINKSSEENKMTEITRVYTVSMDTRESLWPGFDI